MARALLLLLLGASAVASCRGTEPAPSAHSAEHAAESAPVAVAALRSAETRRDSSAIGDAALSSRDLPVRRAAARALARIADARAVTLLSLALSDEDADVNSWAAYGLGFACRGREVKTVRTLIARAASLDPAAHSSAPLASPSEAIADALGRCAAPEAESTLRAWLDGPKGRAEAAALGLGRLATRNGRLSDATLVALLEAADRAQDPLENALYPCTRLESFNASTEARVRTLALRVLTSHGPGLEFALRALAHTGDEGRTALGAVLADPKQDPTLRAQAAHELGALGSAGQAPLWAAFDTLGAALPSDSDLQSERYGPLSALLDALSLPVVSSGSKLQALADLPLTDHDTAELARRKTHLRCSAAALLAVSNYQNARLVACDPNPQSLARALRVVQVLGRERLRGSRKQAYLALAAASDDVLREAAVSLLAEHAELPEAYRVLGGALTAKSLGVVASAAQVLSSYPERAARAGTASAEAHAAPNPDPSVVQALTQAYAATSARNNIEVQSLLLDAIGALQILSLKQAVTQACTSDNPTLREHAEKSLRLLGEPTRQCDQFTPGSDPGPSPSPPPAARLTLETDAGTLTLELDPSLAPNAVARVLSLAEAGFYDGVAVHRVVPGFVAQFGDPSGDGYGGDDRPPLRCETSPMSFGVGSVGVALAGRDTGSSQLFVTLGRYPHLDGEYAWLGQAGPGWDRIAAGDRILRVRVDQGR